MLKLIQAPTAESDLVEIWLYVAEDQPINADRLLDRLHQAAQALSQTPRMGRGRPDLAAGIHSFPVGSFVIYYRITSEFLEIVRVLSATRDLEKLSW